MNGENFMYARSTFDGCPELQGYSEQCPPTLLTHQQDGM